MEVLVWTHSHTRRVQKIAMWIVIVLSCLRLAHGHLLWADEDYHLAAALNILHGKVPYRDFWYDKPPLSALYYALIGGYSGFLLRAMDAVYVIACCYVLYRIAQRWWTEREALGAATLLAFFLAFYLPSAVVPFAADAVMLLPHLLAIYCATCRRPFLAGLFAGIGFLANIKALFVVAVCGLWLLPEVLWVTVGFLLPIVIGYLLLFALGAWPGYFEQVWRWGLVYAAGSPVTHPFSNGLQRTWNWLGFHAALALGAGYALLRRGEKHRARASVWIALSFVAVALGSRFAPHYFLQLLPALAVPAARGIVLAWDERRRVTMTLLIVTLAVPFVRFGPRYVSLAFDEIRGRSPTWSDVAMDVDSREAAKQISSAATGGDTLFVWGYRPDLYVYTRMVSDGRFWDSQPLTGVAADRHLHATTAIYSRPAGANRLELIRSRPTWIVDGLGLLNPKLAPEVYPELRSWLAHYKLVGKTKLSLIYRRAD